LEDDDEAYQYVKNPREQIKYFRHDKPDREKAKFLEKKE
jgi:hypothetical protein